VGRHGEARPGEAGRGGVRQGLARRGKDKKGGIYEASGDNNKSVKSCTGL